MLLCNDCLANACMAPVDLDISGTANKQDLQSANHAEAEYKNIDEIVEFYHYFYNDPTIVTAIQFERITKSKIKCACENCIITSLNTITPHYGDGAYGTCNTNIKPQTNANPQTIIDAHGLGPNIEKRILRAVLRLNNPSAFRKFQETGGVLRSKPDPNIKLQRDSLIGHNIEDAEVIRIERWDGQVWKYWG